MKKTKHFFLIFVVGFFFSSSSFSNSPQFVYEDVLLSDWGLTDVSEIGFAGVGLSRPPSGEKLAIYELRKSKPLIQKVQAQPAAPLKIPSKDISRELRQALWLWETEKILKSPAEFKKLLQFCEKQKITDLFIQIPYRAQEKKGEWRIEWDSSAFTVLVSALHEQNVQVHALDGSPRSVLRQSHGQMLSWIRAIIEYNRSVTAPERFDGIHYDNEPYLLPTFGGVNKEFILKQYVELLQQSYALCKENGLALGADIPFWFNAFNDFGEPTASLEGKSMEKWIVENVDYIGLMDYRTVSGGADGVIAHARSVLEYASQENKKVFVGLETSEFADETLFEYLPQGKGSALVLKKRGKNKARIYWIPEDRLSEWKAQALKGEERILYQSKKILVAASRITFAQKTLQDFQRVVKDSAAELRQYPSFYGFAIHSYESYSQWLAERGVN